VAGPDAPPEVIREVELALGLDQPLHVQYGRYLGRVLRGDFGRSIRSREPVFERLRTTFPVTLTLAVVAVALTTFISVPMGILAAYRRNSALDLAMIFVVLTGSAMPVFATGLILLWVFAVRLRWFPLAGFASLTTLDGWWHIALPALTVSTASTALLARLTRSSMLEVLNQEYVRTARAKGVREVLVVVRHAFRNALLPVITVIGLQFGALLGGAILTETTFAWPGMGRLLVNAITSRDYPVIPGVVLTFAIVFTVVNLAVDLLYAYVDPRIHYG
jgi:ABC-type dipeptide/oligopeptide/nickel transport system permease component